MFKNYSYNLVILLLSFVLFNCDGPDTYVYLGHQIPKKYISEIEKLSLLEEDEQIKYFYSDALTDIKDGFYFVSDKKLVLYSNEWAEPSTEINFDDISFLEITYDDSFLNDSYITVETKDGLLLEFPVSSERKRDKKFFEFLKQKTNISK